MRVTPSTAAPIRAQTPGRPSLAVLSGFDRISPAGDPFQREKREKILSTISTDASPEERETLVASLSGAPLGVLAFVADHGVRIRLMHPGDPLERADVLRDQSVKAFEARLPELRNWGERLHRELSGSPKVEKQEQLKELLVPATPPRRDGQLRGVTFFIPRAARILGQTDLPLDPTETPTMEAIALAHGARSEDQKQLFYRWLQGLNGDRLERAVREGIEQKAARLRRRPEAEETWRNQAKERPETVPLDVVEHTLLVPDLYVHDTLLLDRYDRDALDYWQEEDGRRGARGQVFFLGGMRRFLVRSDSLDDKTPLHELGHVVDLLLEQVDPVFSRELQEQVSIAYHRAVAGSRTVSSYAAANSLEYFAEGFYHYLAEPARLREVDPSLHALMKAAIDRASTLGGVDPALDERITDDLRSLEPQLRRLRTQTPPADELRAASGELRHRYAKALAKGSREACLQAVTSGLFAGAIQGVLVSSAGGDPVVETAREEARTIPAERASEALACARRELHRAAEDPERLFALSYETGALTAFLVRP